MKKLLIGLFFAVGLIAQNTGQNVIQIGMNSANCTGFTSTSYTQLITTNTNFGTGALQNIGQTSHQLTVIVTGATVNYGALLRIQGSTDNANWFDIGPTYDNQAIPAGVFSVAATGFQPYPFIRIKVTISILSNTSLSVAINYAGSSAPSHNLIDSIAINDSIINHSSTAAGGSSIFAITLTPNAELSAVMYGLTLSSPAGVTGINIGCSAVGSTLDYNLLSIPNLTVNIPALIWQVGFRSLGQCPNNQPIYIAATGTGNVSYTIQYRIE